MPIPTLAGLNTSLTSGTGSKYKSGGTGKSKSPSYNKSSNDDFYPFADEYDLFPTSQEDYFKFLAPLDGWGTGNTPFGAGAGVSLGKYDDPVEEGGQGGSYWGGGGGYGGGSGGSYSQSTGYQPSDVQWTIGDYDVGNFENAPDWWQPMIPTNQTELNNPQVAYTMMQNALIGSGTLSEEDSRAAAKSLSNMWGMQEANNPWGLYTTTPDSVNLGEFAGLDPMSAAFQAPQSEEQAALGFTAPKTIDSNFMQSQGRAQQMLGAINNMTQATIGDDQYKYGPGLDYLQSIAGSLGEQGNQGRLTRQESLEMRGVMDPMLAQSAGGELGPYSEIARMMSNPFFANQPPGLTQMPGGGTQFGERNRNLSF